MKVTPTPSSRVPKAIKDAVERGTNTTGGGAPKPMGPRPMVGKMVPDAKAPKPTPMGPRPTVGKMVPDAKSRGSYNYGKDAAERGSNTKGGGAPKPMGPRPTVGKMVPDAKAPKPVAPDSTERSKTPKPAAPAPTVYRAKKGDGLWQVAEKTVPAGMSTSAWWAKIKKLNSTNGKVNRTFTNSGIKLPKK